WNLSGDLGKEWKAQPSSGSAQLDFLVGDLAAGAAYGAYIGDTKIGSFTADSTGSIAFSVVPGVTWLQVYSVRPE
ncbi:MAG: hypothetical protein ACLGI7_14420, partial [Gammaproteobacteria bacterium]